MSRKTPLTTQTAKLFIVIRKTGKEIPNKKLVEAYCRDYFSEFAMIEHTQDIDPVTALVIPKHYHIVGRSKKTKTPISTHLNDLSKYFGFNDSNGIEIDKYDNYIKSVQYLIHKNNPEKTQHEAKEIVTNIEEEVLRNILASETGEDISYDLVYSVCRTAHNICEVIKEIGFKTFNKYSRTILLMWEYIASQRNNGEKV